MPTKPNKSGKQQEYIPAGNGEKSGQYLGDGVSTKSFKSFSKTQKNKNVNKENSKKTQKLEEELKSTLENYTSGKYSFYCEYSQGIIENNENIKDKALKYNTSYGTSKEETIQKIEDTKKIIEIIENQPLKEQTLYRIEREFLTNKINYKVGEIIKWGIRSTTKDNNFADKVLNGFDKGFDKKDFLNGCTIFKIEGKIKSLDIDKYSKFDQQEALVYGNFKVKNIEEDNLLEKWEKQKDQKINEYNKQVDYVLKYPQEFAKKYNIEFKKFTSKSGQEMMQIGKTITLTKSFDNQKAKNVLEKYANIIDPSYDNYDGVKTIKRITLVYNN